MQKARRHPKAVLLPNSTVLIAGGEGIDPDPPPKDPYYPERSSEVFDPETEIFESFLTMGTGEDDSKRRYHSEAFLLPDGRVVTAGDDPYEGHMADEVGATYNVYYPTYASLARPTIENAPSAITYGDALNLNDFLVCAGGITEEADLHSVVLMRPGSTSHSVDFDQRLVRLGATFEGQPCAGDSGRTISVTPPRWVDGDWQKHVAPQGYYMLIVRKANGNNPIPSVAKFVKLCPAPGGCKL